MLWLCGVKGHYLKDSKDSKDSKDFKDLKDLNHMSSVFFYLLLAPYAQGSPVSHYGTRASLAVSMCEICNLLSLGKLHRRKVIRIMSLDMCIGRGKITLVCWSVFH